VVTLGWYVGVSSWSFWNGEAKRGVSESPLYGMFVVSKGDRELEVWGRKAIGPLSGGTLRAVRVRAESRWAPLRVVIH